jgi:hypothetical protein
MCLIDESIHEHAEPINAYKTVIKLADGSLVSPKCHIHDKMEEYTYQQGENTPDNGFGLHTYETQAGAEMLARAMASFVVSHKFTIESVIVIGVTIPVRDDTEYGRHLDDDNGMGFKSQVLIVDTTPLSEYPPLLDGEFFGEFVHKLFN